MVVHHREDLMMTACFALLVTLAAAGSGNGVTLRPCPAASEQPSGALCGQVSVPEDRGVKGGRQISLSVVVLPSRSPAGKSDPVFGLAGGPGIGATRLAVSYPRLYDMLQNDHDIVLVDQRGTGDSNPLVCGADLSKNPGRVLDEWPDDKALTECRDQLTKTADLRQYTTSAAVDDLEAVRQALGYEKIDLLGISYGTRVALEYGRKYTARVRAMALNGVFSPAYRVGFNGPRESQQALQNLFGLCARDAACSGAFPRLADDFATVTTALEKAPAAATLPLAEGQPPMKVAISRRVFARELGQMLLMRDDLTAVPLVIHAAAVGDYVPFAGLAIMRQLARNPPADGAALSVLCSDGGSPMNAADLTAATRGTFQRDDRAQFLKHACAIWPRAAGAALSATPVRAVTPALLISGALDPIVPQTYAAEVAKGLPNSLHVTVANVAHVPANPCVHGMLAAFLKSGTTNGLETGCAAGIPPLKFVTSLPKVQ